MADTIFVTGGAGFIGSNFVLRMLAKTPLKIVNIDKLTYSANLQNLSSIEEDHRHIFQQLDINDAAGVRTLFRRFQPRGVVHFAAESHVDRSIHGPADFVETNIKGTFTMLEEAREYWKRLETNDADRFRFIHVSTDEVYGSLGPDDAPFTEEHKYHPSSPYSASKAAADHLVTAYKATYGLPTIITNCSNNYGPFQFPEKLIPLTILNAISNKPIPIYGDGKNVRDWLYVEDHCDALELIMEHGRPGETYNVGAGNQKTNLELVGILCNLLDELRPGKKKHFDQVEFVKDRPGHDRRYAIDSSKLSRELGWAPRHQLSDGLRTTVNWYLANEPWVQSVQNGAYKSWIHMHYSSK